MIDRNNHNRQVQYELMFGREATEAIHKFPVGYLPVGCLERHGDHMPMGLDAIRAYKVSCIVANAVGGIVFPPHYYAGIHNMSQDQLEKYTGEWGNIYTDNSAKNSLLDIINQIAITGIRVLVLYSGHYPQCQVEMIRDISESFSDHPSISVIPFCESMIMPGDHAGVSETSFMLYLDKELVEMSRIQKINYDDHGWQQHNSPEKATFEKGKDDVKRVIDHLKCEIERILSKG